MAEDGGCIFFNTLFIATVIVFMFFFRSAGSLYPS